MTDAASSLTVSRENTKSRNLAPAGRPRERTRASATLGISSLERGRISSRSSSFHIGTRAAPAEYDAARANHAQVMRD